MAFPTSLIASALLIATGNAMAAPSPGNCPDAILATEATSAALGPWEAVIDESKGGRTLEQIRVYTGHPREMGSLMPDNAIKRSGKLVSTWQLASPDARGGYWLGCAYRIRRHCSCDRFPQR
jgi:hypothetical protein